MNSGSKSNRILYEHTWTVPSASFHCSLVDWRIQACLFLWDHRGSAYIVIYYQHFEENCQLHSSEVDKTSRAKRQRQVHSWQCLSEHQLVAMPVQSWLGFNCQSLACSFFDSGKTTRQTSLPLHTAVAEVKEGPCSSFCFFSFNHIPEKIDRRALDPSLLSTMPLASDAAAVRIISPDPD